MIDLLFTKNVSLQHVKPTQVLHQNNVLNAQVFS